MGRSLNTWPSPNQRLQRTRARPTGGRSPLSRKSFGVMIQHLAAKVVSVGVALFMVVDIAMSAPLRPEAHYQIFFPELALSSSEGERVEHIQISMSCGSFRAVSVIPEDWSVQVVSKSSEQTRFEADAGHGSTVLWNLDQLQGAVTISVDEARCFTLSAKITAAMQDSERVIDLPLSRLVLRP